jgi:hypothetical protein
LAEKGILLQMVIAQMYAVLRLEIVYLLEVIHAKMDPIKVRFLNSDVANKMLSRPQRFPYGTNTALKPSKN